MVHAKRGISRKLYWTPRIIAILLLGFMALFSLDVIEPSKSIGEILIGLFMHNIPVFILAVLLWLAWTREWIGTIAFTLGGCIYVGFVVWNLINDGFEWYYLAWTAQIALPAFVVAYLFWLNWKKR